MAIIVLLFTALGRIVPKDCRIMPILRKPYELNWKEEKKKETGYKLSF